MSDDFCIEDLLGDGSSTNSLEEQGIYYLSGEIDNRTVTPIIMAILEKNSDASWNDPIVLYVNSRGGVVTEGFALVDVMRTSKVPIITVGIGSVMSMGIYIVAAGTPGNRKVMPSTEIMLHQLQAGLPTQPLSNAKAMQSGIQLIEKRYIDFWKKHSKFKTEKDVRKNLIKIDDNFITPEQALEFGIIDEILKWND